MKRIIALVLTLATVLCLFAACTQTPAGTTGSKPTTNTTAPSATPSQPTTAPNQPTTAPTAPADPEMTILTIAEAVAIAEKAGTTPTEEKYYVAGTVTQIQNDMWGNMVIADETGSILIYGLYSGDGSTRYDAMEAKPDLGDKVVVTGVLMSYNNSTPQIKDAWLVSYEEGELVTPDDPNKPSVDWSEYNIITIAEALTICEQTGATATNEKYYIRGTITSVSDAVKGIMTIRDETGSIYIYCTYSADGSMQYGGMAAKPVEGDEVLLCGVLLKYSSYSGTTCEMKNASIIDYKAGAAAEMPEYDTTLTVSQLLMLPLASGSTTSGRYYVTATIDSVTNAAFGTMNISDNTGSISVYNSANADGSMNYSKMEEKPYKGDVVTMYVTVQNYNGTIEIKSAYIISWEAGDNAYNEADYTKMTIADAREKADGTKVTVTGVVAQITYAQGQIPCGVILIDGTSSIYVYDGDLAARVNVGNTITIGAIKDHWILDREQSAAAKHGYLGCNQLTDVYLLNNDEGNTAFDTSWVTETTVKELVETPVTEDITSLVYKVTAYVHRDSTGYLNYYFFDLDGTTGSYTYTQCNCTELDGWLSQYAGKICTVYLMALNAKSNDADCFWRLYPVALFDEKFDVSTVNPSEFAVKYYGVDQFMAEYTSDPALELVTSVDSTLLNFAGAALSYSSDNTAVVYFETVDGKTIMHCGEYGTANVTITGTYNGVTHNKTLTITVKEPVKIEYVDVKTAIDTEPGENVIVTVKGIVGPSLVNQVGFYLIDETGIIAVRCNADVIVDLKIGQEVVITGTRHKQTKGGDKYFGQTCIDGATVVVNNYGEHEYSTASFAGNISVEEFYKLDALVDYSTTVYTVTGIVAVSGQQVVIKDSNGNYFSLYAGGTGQYSWLLEYSGQEVTMEIACCNWNGKPYWRGCVLSVILADGTKVYNELNFNND